MTKKVIEGKLYNTEAATKVASWDNGVYGNDFRACDEELYQTKKGNWFMVGSGGPMSKYSVTRGNSTSGTTEIVPMTKEEAYEWLEKNNEIELIEEYFGQIEEA